MIMMGDSFLRNTLLFTGLFWCLFGSLQAQDCPQNAEFRVVHEQTPNGNDGEITVTFSGLHGDMTPSEQGLQYSLWNREVNGYVYDQAKLDPGFHLDSRITQRFKTPGTITFRNVPARSGYTIVLTGSSCRKTFNPATGEITIKAFNK